MNTLSSLPPALLAPAALPGSGTLAPTTAPTGPTRQAGSWLDEGTQGQSEPLHVGPNSRPRAIEDIEHDFVQALCLTDPDKRV
jgi:hypothetical protein